MDFEKRYKQLYKEFEDTYDLSTLNNANDSANLEQLIRNIILTERLDQQTRDLMARDDITTIVNEIKKLSDIAVGVREQNMQLERQLGIDRKSRKKDSDTSSAQYILHLKRIAKEYLDERLIKVFCPTCKVMVFRFAPVHDHTAFKVAVACSQCHKLVIAERQERDIFYDLKPADRAWRKEHPVVIKQPKQIDTNLVFDTSELPPDIIIEEDE